MTAPAAPVARGSQPSPRARQLMVVAVLVAMVVVALLYLAFGLLTAEGTLGCDYGSYSGAASRFLAGEPVYLPGPARTGACPLFPYPPPFVLIVVPFVWLGAAGMWAWIAVAWLSFAVGTAILPVDRWIRLAVFLLGSIGWPMIYGVRIGQVVPLLYLVFAIGWNALGRDRVFGAVAAIGTLIKVQPGLLLVWLLAGLRLRAVAAALVTMGLISAAAAVVGLTAWPEFFRTAFQISNAVDVPANLSIGATVYRAGTPADIATLIQTANTAAMVGVAVVAARWLPAVPGYLAVAVGSQILTPIVWSHYALLVLLGVAWLLQRRQWWVLAIPVLHAWMLILVMPTVVYTISFYVVIAGLFVIGWRDRPERRPGAEAQREAVPSGTTSHEDPAAPAGDAG